MSEEVKKKEKYTVLTDFICFLKPKRQLGLLKLLILGIVLFFVFIILIICGLRAVRSGSLFSAWLIRQGGTPILSGSLKPTSVIDSTADFKNNWKVYTNQDGGYELKYPPNNYVCGSRDKYPYYETNRVVIRPGEPCDCGFAIEVIDNPNLLSPLEFFESLSIYFWGKVSCTQTECKEEFEKDGQNYTNTYGLETIMVGGRQGIKISDKEVYFSTGKAFDSIYVESKKGKILLLEVCSDSINNQILSTLTFKD